MEKNNFKPEVQIGEGIDNTFSETIKEEINKRKIISCRLTEAEYNKFVKARGKEKTDSKYLRELIKKAVV